MIQKLSEISWSKRVGTKAVNALSNYFRVESVRDENKKRPNSAGNLVLEEDIIDYQTKGTKVIFYS
jgi:topoisomerase-4 subunit B